MTFFAFLGTKHSRFFHRYLRSSIFSSFVDPIDKFVSKWIIWQKKLRQRNLKNKLMKQQLAFDVNFNLIAISEIRMNNSRIFQKSINIPISHSIIRMSSIIPTHCRFKQFQVKLVKFKASWEMIYIRVSPKYGVFQYLLNQNVNSFILQNHPFIVCDILLFIDYDDLLEYD